MGTKGIEILELDVNQLIAELNKALADEWLAYYQYWIGALVVKGMMREAAVKELTEHAGDELKHANMLAERILQLGGTPILDPKDMGELTNCGYLVPTDHSVEAIIKQGVHGEQCAIEVYKKLLNLTFNKDEITYSILLSILKDEVDHEDDFETLLADLKA